MRRAKGFFEGLKVVNYQLQASVCEWFMPKGDMQTIAAWVATTENFKDNFVGLNQKVSNGEFPPLKSSLSKYFIQRVSFTDQAIKRGVEHSGLATIAGVASGALAVTAAMVAVAFMGASAVYSSLGDEDVPSQPQTPVTTTTIPAYTPTK